jgi:hypothetical protein
LLDRRISTTLGDPVAVGFGGALCADGGQSVLAVGMVDMGEECAACAGQGHPAAEQVAGGAPRGRRHRGLREHPAASKPGNCLGIARVVCGLAAVDGLQRQRMAEEKRHPVVSAAVRQPVPGKQACGCEDALRAGGRNGLEPRLGGRGPMAVQACCPGLVEDADVHGAGVEIDPTGKGMVLRVKSP